MRKFSIFNFQFSKNKGFTLIELLIVIAIIGILSGLLMVNFIGIRARARDAQRKSDLRQIQSALELYRADNGSYPVTASFPSCGSSFTNGSNTYIQKVPCDPLNSSPYVYTYSSSDGTQYSIIACLENINDSQKDSSNVSPCDSTNNWSYTLQNP